MASEKILKQKQAVIDEIKDRAQSANTIVLFDYRGMTDSEAKELRVKLRESNSDYKVYKNTLMARAFNDLGIDLNEGLNGPSAFAFGEDQIAPIKVLSDFAKDHPALVLKVGLVDGEKAAGMKFAQNPFSTLFWETTISSISDGIIHPLSRFGLCVTNPDYIGTYFNMVKVTLCVFGFFAIIGIVKAIPSHEYEDIENGSSDWCEGGEQYKVLSKNKGIVLAEKHYLPVDKRGNVNVLVVRRIWCW